VIRQDAAVLRLPLVDLIVIGILIGLVLISLGIAWWQIRSVAGARQAFDRAAKELPTKIVGAVRVVVQFSQEGSAVHPTLQEPWCGAIDYVDVNDDGGRELLLQYPTGAHGSALKVFVWRDAKFQELSALTAGTPAGFEFGDFDGDGKIEIRTRETDWSVGLPYASAHRLFLLFRWDGSTFTEVSRKRMSGQIAGK
jgi:hypothetical protein